MPNKNLLEKIKRITWNIVFGLFYPIITAFSYILTAFLSVFSKLSGLIAKALSSKETKD